MEYVDGPSLQKFARHAHRRGKPVPVSVHLYLLTEMLTALEYAHGLTEREAEILVLLSEGLRNAVIAKRLFVSTKTVDHHVSAVLTKLGVRSRAEAVAMARKQSEKGGV